MKLSQRPKWNPKSPKQQKQTSVYRYENTCLYLLVANKDQPVKRNVFMLSLKGYTFQGCNFVKFYTFFWEILCVKNQEVESVQNESDLAMLTFHVFIFSRTTGPILTKLGTRHPWVKGIQVCTNERPRPFPIGDNNKIVRVYWQHLKIFWTTGPITNCNSLVFYHHTKRKFTIIHAVENW